MDVNNHIHTVYSFSPYTPREVVIKAKEAGLFTCGLMDHDTMAGAYEFLLEAKKMNMPVTCGLELRVKMGESFSAKRLNNSDQNGIAYFTLHGVPRQNINYVTEYFAQFREKRNERNSKMCEKLSAITGNYGINLSFESDVLPLSASMQGGTVTERHICYAFGRKLISRCGRGAMLIKFLTKLGANIPKKTEEYLLDIENPYYEYDLLELIKNELSRKFFIPADEECMKIEDFIRFGKEVGGIIAYAYLGDVVEGIEGDKFSQKFEDDFLEELVEYLADKGVQAISYIPGRNDVFQLKKLRELCEENNLMELSGESINSSRQELVCKELNKQEHKHLIDTTLALIGHEAKATDNIEDGMFSEKTIAEIPSLAERIKYFKQFATI